MADWYNRQQPNFRYELESIFNGTRPVRPMDDMNLKSRVLCEKPCNGEWGSDLETRIARILTPMIHGESHQLDDRAIQLVSAWFVLKVMASEYLLRANARGYRFFKLEHGEHLKEQCAHPRASQYGSAGMSAAGRTRAGSPTAVHGDEF